MARSSIRMEIEFSGDVEPQVREIPGGVIVFLAGEDKHVSLVFEEEAIARQVTTALRRYWVQQRAKKRAATVAAVSE